MSWRWTHLPARLTAAIAVTALVTAAAVTNASAQAEPSPEAGLTVTVTPMTDLIDHQVVTVTGSGFDPDHVVGFAMCRTDAEFCSGNSESNPDYIGVEADGTFSHPFGVTATIEDRDGTFDCRLVPGSCVLAVGESTGRERLVALTFDAGAPLAPPPQLTVTPSAALVDGTTVDLAVSGFRPHASMVMTLCAGAAPPFEVCENRAFHRFNPLDVSGDGRVDTTTILRTVIEVEGFPDRNGTSQIEETFDCRSGPCSLVVEEFQTDFSAETASATVSFDPDAPLAPPATLTASPATGLHHGDEVHVTGEGFFPGDTVNVNQCSIAQVPRYCSYGPISPDVLLTVADDGTIDTTVHVRRVIGALSGDSPDADCTGVSCVVSALAYADGGDRIDSEVLSFVEQAGSGPNAAATPVAVAPRFTG
jgi:hypothetical protein